jgi:hypothetical protein
MSILHPHHSSPLIDNWAMAQNLGKVVDLSMEIMLGVSFCWESSMQEPLIMCISLPLCRHLSCTCKCRGFIERLQRKLHQVWKCVREWVGNLLPTSSAGERISLVAKEVWCGSYYGTMIGGDQFLILASMDKDRFANIVAGDELRFKRGRNGDDIMTPFQCVLCHF